MRTFLFDPLGKEESRLAITREKKEQFVAQYTEEIGNASAIVFTNYRGVSVSQIQSLRTKLQDTGTKYMVVKNTLLPLSFIC